jgi:UPF0755 protein
MKRKTKDQRSKNKAVRASKRNGVLSVKIFGRKHRLGIVIIAAFALCSLLFGLFLVGFQSKLKQDMTFEVVQGASVSGIARQLKFNGLIESEDMFVSMVTGFGGRVQIGIYDIPARTSTWRIAKMISRGEVAATTIMIPEGLTVRQIIMILEANPHLRGEIECAERRAQSEDVDSYKLKDNNGPNSELLTPGSPSLSALRSANCYKDGELFPDTYRVAKGTNRAAVLQLMRKKMETMEKNWGMSGRQVPRPLKSWNDVVTLASIVQKETPKASEMPMVASVYLNRLRKKMRLQADPTVVYALTNRLGDMQGRALLTGHLQTDSPYNTYKNYGLPPHPIANVGSDAIRAVLNPADTNYLFFVADGTGGHVFSRSYDEHQANHAKWREIKKNNNSAK